MRRALTLLLLGTVVLATDGILTAPAPPPPFRLGAHVSTSQYGGTANALASIRKLEDILALPRGALRSHRMFFTWGTGPSGNPTILGSDGNAHFTIQGSLDDGRLVMLSLNPRNGTDASGNPLDWADVASGCCDAAFTRVAQALQREAAAHPSRVMFTWSAEPKFHSNRLPQHSGTPTDYRQSFARVSGIFRGHAPGVVLYFVGEDFNMGQDWYWTGTNRWAPDPADYDVIGMDIYDFGANTSLRQDIQAEYAKVKQYVPPRPAVLPEFGTDRTGSAQGQWLRDCISLFKELAADPTHPLIAASYFDSGGETLDSGSHPWIREQEEIREALLGQAPDDARAVTLRRRGSAIEVGARAILRLPELLRVASSV